MYLYLFIYTYVSFIATHLERTVWNSYTSVSDDNRMFHILLGHVTASECTVLVVLIQFEM